MGTIAASITSMIASLAVERHGVRLHAIAQISAVCFMSGGSASLAAMALRNCILVPLIRIFLIGFVLSNTCAQFTSTLLLADLDESRIISFPRHPSDAYRSLQVADESDTYNFVSNLSFCHFRKDTPNITLCGTARVDGLTLEDSLGAEPSRAGTGNFSCSLSGFAKPEQVWQVCPLDVRANWTKIGHGLDTSGVPALRRMFLFWDAGNFLDMYKDPTSSGNERSRRLHRRALNGTGNNTVHSVLSSKANMWLTQTFDVMKLVQLFMEEAMNVDAASNSTSPEDRQIMHISSASLKSSLSNTRNRVTLTEYSEVDALADDWLYGQSLDRPLSFCLNCEPHKNMTQAH
ncbi:hypothetical protein GCG54_00001977 [Colletotrichum gloeosporioides]|uniref:Uncharacterized protein n=1 Tax=Colletotrichum gloeosporioides TaxID=474922 RepID=A0A8H4CWY8_COLGL|nr:uncharacterized protein GCG54_00001977 [Colletotrichum gloeosporioides]KAF3811648.1 hypothetical protein GCG54_00001977 [Colletotrichum gloeosporioides]